MWIAIIGGILALVGLGWLLWSIWANWKSSQVRNWPRTNATVVSAAAESVDLGPNQLIDPETIQVVNNNSTYKAHVVYRYEVMGRATTSNNFMYGKEYFNAQEIRTLLAPLRPGSTITVMYNPDNHDEAYVYDANRTNWTGVWGGIVLILAGLLLLALGKKSDKKKSGNGFDDKSDVDLTSTDPGDLTKELNKINKRKADLTRNIAARNDVRADLSKQLNILNREQALIEQRLAAVRPSFMAMR